MRVEVRRLEPLRTANIYALVSLATGLASSLLMAPLFLLIGLLGSSFKLPGISEAFGRAGLLVISPVVSAILGWITGFVGAALYNVVVRWTGKLSIEIDVVERIDSHLFAPPTGASETRP